MSYDFTAKPLPIGRDVVHLINGRMQQLGYRWQDCDLWPGETASAVAEQALMDAAYGLDAPDEIPLGACYGEHCYEEFAAAIQMKVPRP